jgi:hypothetical protein
MNEIALRHFFNDQAMLPQQLGVIDCVSFVTGAVQAGWGRDYHSVLKYQDRRSAVKRLRELGGLKNACTYAMGEMVPIDELSPGDVVWFEQPTCIGLLMPEYVAVKQGRTINRYAIDPRMMGWRTDGR